MASRKRRALRSANPKVRFDLSQYIGKLANVFGCEASDASPGPVVFGRRDNSTDPERDFALKLLFDEILSKFDDGKASKEKYEKCLDKFYEAERLCQDTNWRFKDRSCLYHGVTQAGYSPAQAVRLAREKIADLLSDFDMSYALPYMGHGPGATTRLKRSEAHLARKMGGVPHSTKALAPAIPEILREFPVWESYFGTGPVCEIVTGNKLVSVPKSYKTDRMIAIEPEWNMFVQKGIGGYLRSRLRRWGIELNDQSNNQLLAGLGSLYGDLATIDLSMASDCVSYELVRYLLPPDVFDALEQCRSPVGWLDSGGVLYQKFSSMGNGATFELETVIFAALAKACVELSGIEDRRVLVYGDDIILSTEAFANMVDLLVFAGFKPNPEKSFGSGPFRESCGSQFYEGRDVTPIYIREPITRLDRLFLLHNNTCRLLERLQPFVEAGPEEVREFLSWIRSHAPKEWRKPRLPRMDIGDGAFVGSFEEVTPRKARCGWDGWRVKILQERLDLPPQPRERWRCPETKFYLEGPWTIEDNVDQECLYLASLYDLERRPYKPILERTPRGELVCDSPEPRQRIAGVKTFWSVKQQIVVSLSTETCWWHTSLHATVGPFN